MNLPRKSLRFLHKAQKGYWVVLSFVLSSFAFAPRVAVAQPGTNPPLIRLENPIKYENLGTFLIGILDVVIDIGTVLIVFFVVYAGFLFVAARGNAEKLTQAKRTFTWVVVGAFVLLGAKVLLAAICGTVKGIGENLPVGC